MIESLPAIEVPTLVLVGENDQQFGLRPITWRKNSWRGESDPRASGYAANIDQPDAFNAAVRAFLERVSS